MKISCNRPAGVAGNEGNYLAFVMNSFVFLLLRDTAMRDEANFMQTCLISGSPKSV